MAWPDLERARLVYRAGQVRREIDQMRVDCEAWNRHHPERPPLDWDPDGSLRRLALQLDTFLNRVSTAQEGGA